MPYLKPKVCICVDKVDSDWKVCFHSYPPRLLLTLTEEEFSKAPYTIESSSHRRAILMELERVKALGVKPPQNLWEYKVNTLFLQWKKKSIENEIAVICLPTARRHGRHNWSPCQTGSSLGLLSYLCYAPVCLHSSRNNILDFEP